MEDQMVVGMLCSCTWPRSCSGLGATVGLGVIAPWTGQLVNNEQAALITMKYLMGSNESNQESRKQPDKESWLQVNHFI